MDETADLHEISGRRELLRWSVCFLLVIMAHGAGALALLAEKDRGEVSDSAPAVIMDFAALPITDAPPREIAPGREQVQTEAAPPPTEAKPDPMRETDPVKEPLPVQANDAPPQESTEIKRAVEDRVPIQELPPVPDAEVAIATAAPPPAPEVKDKTEESEKKSEARLTPPLATASETTAPTMASVRSASLVSWKIRVATHLQRYKRYPPAAFARGEHGTAELKFIVDRKGHVVSAKVQHGSGHASLDEETLALIQRAQPLPRPPGDVAGNEFSFTVPVRFSAK